MTRHVIETMGTVFSLDIRDEHVDEAVVERVADDLRWVDSVFSTYRADSEISRLARGDIRVDACVPEVGEVLALCDDFARRSDGFFTATPGGRLDPSGLVKGWAIARASAILSAAGLRCHAVNGGGDIQTVGSPEPETVWRIGITDPRDRDRLATVVLGTGIAIATSGVAERGGHVVNPFTGRSATDLLSVTVVGPEIVPADVFATAAVAMGRAARDWLTTLAGYDAFVIDADGHEWATAGFARYS